MSRKTFGSPAALLIVSTLAGTVLATETVAPALPPQSTWTLTKSSTSQTGQVHVETSYLHLDTLNGKVLVQLDDGHGGFEHELTIGDVEYGYHALSKETLAHGMRDPQLMAAEHAFEDDEQHQIFVQTIAAKQQALDQIVGCKSQAVPQGGASHVFQQDPVLLSQADGKNTWQFTFADGAVVQYVEDAATKKALQFGDYTVASVEPTVDEALFAVPDACLNEADVLSWHENVHAAHELLKARHNGDVSKSPALQSITWTNTMPQYRLPGTLWCGYTNEFDQHKDCSDCSRGCMADAFTYSGARVPYGSQLPAGVTSPSNPNTTPNDIVRFEHVYPLSGATFDSTTPDINQIPSRLRTYRWQITGNIQNLRLPNTGPSAQKLTRCRAVPLHQLNIATTSPTDAAGGLQATHLYNAWESDDKICRQHDFCPLGVGGSTLTCTCDLALYSGAVRTLPRSLTDPNMVAHKCWNLEWKCKDWGLFSCKSASNGGGYRWEWNKVGLNKYAPGEKSAYSLWSPIGRYDSTANICTALRSPKEGKNWVGGLRGDTSGRPSSNVDLYTIQCGSGNACGYEDKVADGQCDDTDIGAVPFNLNTPDHGYDGGDCCAATNPLLTTDAYCKQPACKGTRTAAGFGAWSVCTAATGCGAKKTRTCIYPANSVNEFNLCFPESADLSRNASGFLVQTASCSNAELPAGVAPCVWKSAVNGGCTNACNPSNEVYVGTRFETRTCGAGVPGAVYSAAQSCSVFGTFDNVACPDAVNLCTWNVDLAGNPIWQSSSCINTATGSLYQYCSKVPITLVPATGTIVNADGSTPYTSVASNFDAAAETLANGEGNGSTWPTLSPTSSGSSSDVAIDAATQQSLNPNCAGATHVKDGTWLVKKAPCIARV